MRIVHVVFSFCVGGLETMLVDIMGVQSRAHDVHLIVVNDLVDSALCGTIPGGVKVHYLKRKPGSWNPLSIIRLNSLLLRLRPDVVHLHQGSLAKWIKCGPRPVLTLHDLHIPLDSHALACRLVAISDAVAQDVKNRYGSEVDIAVIPNGISTHLIEERSPEQLPNHVKVVQVGRFDFDKKGQDILIKATAKLVREGYNISLSLIGGADYEKIPVLEELAQREGMGERVSFVKGLSRNELYSTLSGFDLMVHPSRYEGFGLVIAEGMAAGLPLAVPRGGGPFEVADNGRLAEVFEPDDSDSCAAAMRHIIENYAAAQERAEQAKQFVAEHYSLDRMVAQYDRFYIASHS